MEPVVEPNEKVQFEFDGLLSDELCRDADNLVAVDKLSKLPTAKAVTTTNADMAIKLKQRCISNKKNKIRPSPNF